MNQTKSPAFQFYPDDFVGSGKVGMMTIDEVGVYTLLLCLDWNENGFEFDENLLARWCKCSKRVFKSAWKQVGKCFVERDGRFYNPRLDAERLKQAEWRETASNRGKSGADARWHKDAKGMQRASLKDTSSNATSIPKASNGHATGNAQAMLGDSTPSPTPTPVTTNNKKTTTAGRRKTRPEAGTSAIVESSFPKPVCDSLYESWVSGGSSVDYGAFRKALLPLYPHSGPRYTQEELTNAITAFLETRDGVAPTESQFWTVHKFAGDVGRWVRLGSMPVQLADGTLTERGIVALGEVLSA